MTQEFLDNGPPNNEFVRIPETNESDKPEEYCGIYGEIMKPGYQTDPSIALQCIFQLQHRGSHGLGLYSFVGRDNYTSYYHEGLVNSHTSSGVKASMTSGKISIAQNRYGTSGSWNPENNPPVIEGSMVVAHNGNLPSRENLRDAIIDGHNHNLYPEELSDTKLFTRLLAETQGDNFQEVCSNALEKVEGAYSMIITNGEEVFLARDKDGIRPMLIAEFEDRYIIASESVVIDELEKRGKGLIGVRSVLPGEQMSMTEKGFVPYKQLEETRERMCAFEYAYFQRPDSRMFKNHGIWLDADAYTELPNVQNFRKICGELLWAEVLQDKLNIEDFDSWFIQPIPDSGRGFANGVHRASRVLLSEGILRNHAQLHPDFVKRTFTQDQLPNDELMKQVLKKLIFMRDDDLNSAKLILCDDSMVRGNTMKAIIMKLKEMYGIDIEVHCIFGFPMVKKGCHLGISMRGTDRLIANRIGGDEASIAQEIGADSVSYIKPDMFERAFYIASGQPRDEYERHLCMACTGATDSPVNADGERVYPDNQHLYIDAGGNVFNQEPNI